MKNLAACASYRVAHWVPGGIVCTMPANAIASLEFLSATRQLLLVAIKNRGEATTDELSQETYLSPGAVRQHLLALEAKGLVTYMRLRDGPGRPRHVFRLTSNGEQLFPQQYALIANTILGMITDEDPAFSERVMDRLTQAQVETASKYITGKTLAERVQQLSEFVESYGYFPNLDTEGKGPAALTLRHCPLLNVARNHPGVCAVEARAMAAVLGTDAITRTAHRLAGDPVCTYIVG